jgi:hypothetical protein
VYDTQCGAKLFRNTKAIRSVFERPFLVDWSFDVEVIARMIALAERGELPQMVDAAVEYPLRQWHDVAGSKLHAGAALQAALELAKIWSNYPRAKRR